jgi:hypothetical protein
VIHPGQPRTVSYCATRANPPPPLAPPPPVPADQLSYTSVIDSSWSTGYCATVTVNNHGSTSGAWTIEVPFSDMIEFLWNGEYSRTPSSLILRDYGASRARCRRASSATLVAYGARSEGEGRAEIRVGHGISLQGHTENRFGMRARIVGVCRISDPFHRWAGLAATSSSTG